MVSLAHLHPEFRNYVKDGSSPPTGLNVGGMSKSEAIKEGIDPASQKYMKQKMMVQSLLQGNLPSEDVLSKLQPETRQILNTLASTALIQHPSLSTIITPEAFTDCYATVKEHTSSSPSGWHVGHYKATTTSPLLTDSLNDDVCYVSGRLLPKMLVANHRFNAGKAARKHQNPSFADHCTDGKWLEPSHLNPTHQATQLSPRGYRSHTDVQYSCRDGQQCPSAVLKKHLTHEIIRHTKSTMACIKNDAVGCYNRMVNNLLLLELQPPLPIILSLALTWESTIHHIKTNYGVYSTTYKNTPETPLFSLGEGSTLNPFQWLLFFTLIVTLMRANSPKAHFFQLWWLHHTTKDRRGFCGWLFFMCHIWCRQYSRPWWHTGKKGFWIAGYPEPSDYCTAMRSLLFATSGALFPQKSFWYLLSWTWTGATPPDLPRSTSTIFNKQHPQLFLNQVV